MPFSIDITVSKIANIHFFEFEKNFSTKDDKHPFCELVFVGSGTLNVSSEDFNGKLSKKEMIIHRANTFHSLSCTGETSPAVIIIGFECLSEKIDMFSDKAIKLSEANINILTEIVKEGRNVFSPPYNIPTQEMKKKENELFGAEQRLKNLLEYFLLKIIREYSLNDIPDDKSGRPFSLAINEVVNYVNSNLLEKITIDELAFLFNTNRSTLCGEFKKRQGKSIIKYINDKKTELAKEKIVSTDTTFTAISQELNFDSIHYFTRFFKKQTGMTPNEYRKKYKKINKSK